MQSSCTHFTEQMQVRVHGLAANVKLQDVGNLCIRGSGHAEQAWQCSKQAQHSAKPWDWPITGQREYYPWVIATTPYLIAGEGAGQCAVDVGARKGGPAGAGHT